MFSAAAALASITVQTLRESNDVHRHLMDCVAPPRYRLDQPTHCLGSRSQHHCTALPRRPGHRKRRHSRPRGGSSSAGRHVAASPARTWTLRTPPSAQAQPHISRSTDSSIDSWGAGETMSDSGAIDQTGVVSPVSRPVPSSTGSLYQRVVNGPCARLSTQLRFA